MPYLLDSNVFIQAKNQYYGFDFCPAFWQWIICMNEEKKVFSTEKVMDELEGYGDELSGWVRARKGFFIPLTPAVLPYLESVSAWTQAQAYEQMAISEFFQAADFYLISHALALGYTVVTHELPGNSMKKIKIPNVCIGLGVKFINTYELLRKEKARFILEQS